jgi:sec-independent protein translocase protein TatA
MGGFSLWHWLVVGVVILLLFGKGRFSDMMGDVAKGIKSFKKGMAEDDTPPAAPKRIEGDRTIDATANPSRVADPQERREP